MCYFTWFPFPEVPGTWEATLGADERLCRDLRQGLDQSAPTTAKSNLSVSSSSFAFSRQGSPQWIFHLHSVLSSASFSVTSATAMSSLTASINLLFGLHRFLFPGSSFSQYTDHLSSVYVQTTSVLPLMFSPNRPTCAVPLMYSFLILSILVTPNENRYNFNSATSISASCLFFIEIIK